MAMSVNAPAMLTRESYQVWVRQMTRVLECEGLKFWLDKKEWPDSEAFTELEKFRLKQSKQKAAGIIKSYCSPEIELLIGHLSDPAEIWSTLKDALEMQGKGLKSFYLNEFRNLKPAPDEDFQTFIARYEESYRKVLDTGEVVPETHRCYHIVQCLPPELDYLSRELENYTETEFKFEKIKAEILKECFRRHIRKKIRNQLSMTTPACAEKKTEPTCSRWSSPERGEALWHVIRPDADFEEFPVVEPEPLTLPVDFEDLPVEGVEPESSTLPVVKEKESLEEVIIPCTPDPDVRLPEAEQQKAEVGKESIPVPQEVLSTRSVCTVRREEEHEAFIPKWVELRNHHEGSVFGEMFSAIFKLFIALFFHVLGCHYTLHSVKLQFVYRVIDVSRIIRQPAGYEMESRQRSFVPKLNKVICDLLESGRYWFLKLHTKSLCRELCLRYKFAYHVVSMFFQKKKLF